MRSAVTCTCRENLCRVLSEIGTIVPGAVDLKVVPFAACELQPKTVVGCSHGSARWTNGAGPDRQELQHETTARPFRVSDHAVGCVRPDRSWRSARGDRAFDRSRVG